MNWINRNIGPEGCAGFLLLLFVVLGIVALIALLVFGYLVIGPVLQQLERAL